MQRWRTEQDLTRTSKTSDAQIRQFAARLANVEQGTAASQKKARRSTKMSPTSKVEDPREQIGPRAGKAFDTLTESTKQVLGLSSVILGITVTFGKDLVADASWLQAAALCCSWVLFVFAAFFGILALNNQAGIMARPSSRGFGLRELLRRDGLMFHQMQMLAFVMGLVSVLSFGVLRFLLPNEATATKSLRTTVTALAAEDGRGSRVDEKSFLWACAEQQLIRDHTYLSSEASDELDDIFVQITSSGKIPSRAELRGSTSQLISLASGETMRHGSHEIGKGFSKWFCRIFPNQLPYCIDGSPLR